MDVEYSYTGTHQRQPPRRGSFRLSHEGGSLSVASAIDIVPKLTSEEACEREHEHEHEHELDRSVHAKPSDASSLSLSRSISISSPPLTRRSLVPTAASRSAISAGRALLNRPSPAQAAAQASSAQQASSSSGYSSSPFTASAAASPLRRLRTEPAQLKSCLSSSNVLSAKTNPSSSSSSQANRNEEFNLRTMKRNVSFSHLQIREYAITLGDNPSVSSGPPVTLDWAYDPQETTAPVEAFEAVRGPRRPYAEMAMPRSVRTQLLTDEWKVTRSEMDNAIRDANRIKQDRRRTVNNLDTPLEKASYQVEKAKRNTRRLSSYVKGIS